MDWIVIVSNVMQRKHFNTEENIPIASKKQHRKPEREIGKRLSCGIKNFMNVQKMTLNISKQGKLA